MPRSRSSHRPPARRAVRPQPGSLRVQGWLHSALWPLGQALEFELAMLDAGDLSWRHGVGQLAALRGARRHLGPAALANLDDLIDVSAPSLGPALAGLDATVQRLAEAAAVAQAVLVGGLVKAAVARAGARWKHAGDDMLAALAEDVINGALGREVYGSEGELWHDARPHLQGALHDPALGSLAGARAAYRAAVAAVLAELAALRRRLCDAFDLPPAPVARIAGHDAPHRGGH